MLARILYHFFDKRYMTEVFLQWLSILGNSIRWADKWGIVLCLYKVLSCVCERDCFTICVDYLYKNHLKIKIRHQICVFLAATVVQIDWDVS